MDLEINGGYDAYLYVVVLQLSILYLQRLDLNRRMAKQDGEPLSALANDYFIATRLVAAGLNWGSWLLSIYVGKEFGLASGVLFLILGLGSSIMATVVIPPLSRIDVFDSSIDVILHIISLPATIYFLHATLVAVGFWTPI